MERKHLIILGILVFLVCCIAFMTLWLAGQLTNGAGPVGQVTRGTTVESISDVPGFTIDPAFLQATPHWFIVVAGKKEQEAMIRYIENTSASEEKKAAWIATLQDIWAAYPVKAVPQANGALITCDCDLTTMSLTGSENATMGEIEMQIALDMEKASQKAATTTPTAG